MRATPISVLIPTYKRSNDLARCLEAIARQSRPADQVIIVRREDDLETNEFLASEKWPFPLQIVTVQRPGQVAALNAGLTHVRSEIFALTDDDAAPRTDWLLRIERHFASDPRIGGVGGRDYVHVGKRESEQTRVGILQWFGRRIGNHHRGIGVARTVDFLKGVNMSYRIAAVGSLRFDERLRGSGAQVHNDLVFSLAVRRSGWRLMYDPAVAVDHYPAQRFGEDQRLERSQGAVNTSAYNETVALLEHLPGYRHAFFWLWAIVAGTEELPGLLRCVVPSKSARKRRAVLLPMLSGRFAAASRSYMQKR